MKQLLFIVFVLIFNHTLQAQTTLRLLHASKSIILDGEVYVTERYDFRHRFVVLNDNTMTFEDKYNTVYTLKAYYPDYKGVADIVYSATDQNGQNVAIFIEKKADKYIYLFVRYKNPDYWWRFTLQHD